MARAKAKRRTRRQNEHSDEFEAFLEQQPTNIVRMRSREPLKPRTDAQQRYIKSILNHSITFGLGPAGTGKTYVAAGLAAEALAKGDIDKVILCRPMVGCGENLGFLPGEEEEKYAPWIEPVIDVMEERLGKSTVKMFLKNGRIETKPLMFMRGKTHRDTWVMLDEAQNTTPEQMKMFLTRLGEGSKLIVDGDATQSDLRDKRGSRIINGLEDAVTRLRDVPDIGVVIFRPEDIVRHDLVQSILERY